MTRRPGPAWRFAARALVGASLVAPSNTFAQEEDRRIELPPLVVEAERLEPERRLDTDEAREEIRKTPGGAAVVGGEEIGETRAANLEDALGFVPGVLVRPRFGAADESQLSVRGSGLRNNFHLRGINLLIDGFPYGNADGFSDFESLELLAAKRIEVYKGANALRFGASGLGGAVNLVTKTGYDVPPAEIRSEGGSFGFQKHYAATGGTKGPWDAYAAFADTELEGFRDHAEQTRRRVHTTFGYTGDDGRSARLDLSYVHNRETLPGSLTREELEQDPSQASPEDLAADSRRDYEYLRGGVTVRSPLGEDAVVEAAVQGNFQDLDHPLSFAILTGDTWSWSVEPRAVFTAPLFARPNRFTFGLQYAATSQDDVRYENLGGARRGAKVRDQQNEATNLGAYFEERHDLGDATTAVVGGRVQWADRSVDSRLAAPGQPTDDDTDFHSFSPKIGFLHRFRPGVQIFANASHAFEPPLLLELASPATIGGSFDELDAQKSWQFEVGTRGAAGEAIEWDLAVFDVELRDEIRNVNVAPFPGAPFTIPRYENIDRSRHTGVEAGADVRLFRNLASRGDRLGLRTAYTWSRFVFVDDPAFGGNDLPGAPEHFVRSELRYDHPSRFWITPGTDAVPSGYFVDSANTAKTGAYALFGVRAGYDHTPWNLSLFVEGRNLLDETYASTVQVDNALGRFFESGDGRAFYGGVRWQWF